MAIAENAGDYMKMSFANANLLLCDLYSIVKDFTQESNCGIYQMVKE